MTAAGIILAVGAGEVAATALTVLAVLADIATGIGAWVMLCAFLYLPALAVWRARRPDGEAGDDKLTMIARWHDDAVTEELDRTLEGGDGHA